MTSEATGLSQSLTHTHTHTHTPTHTHTHSNIGFIWARCQVIFIFYANPQIASSKPKRPPKESHFIFSSKKGTGDDFHKLSVSGFCRRRRNFFLTRWQFKDICSYFLLLQLLLLGGIRNKLGVTPFSRKPVVQRKVENRSWLHLAAAFMSKYKRCLIRQNSRSNKII